MNTRLIDYCGEKIQEANATLSDVRAIQRRAMNAGKDCASITAQIIGLRERIATYADVSEQARLGRL